MLVGFDGGGGGGEILQNYKDVKLLYNNNIINTTVISKITYS